MQAGTRMSCWSLSICSQDVKEPARSTTKEQASSVTKSDCLVYRRRKDGRKDLGNCLSGQKVDPASAGDFFLRQKPWRLRKHPKLLLRLLETSLRWPLYNIYHLPLPKLILSKQDVIWSFEQVAFSSKDIAEKCGAHKSLRNAARREYLLIRNSISFLWR